jgi:peroxiredoxin
VGLLGKTFGPLGFLWTAWQGQLPWTFAWMLVLNDLIWWYPFAATLYLAFRWNNNPANFVKGATYDEAIRLTRSQRGETLEKISFHGLTMVVFLRHAGCTFCRETLSDMRQIRQDLEQLGIQTAIVHMGRPLDGTTMLAKYDLDHMHHFSDPGCRLYRAFGLERGNWSQLFSWAVLKRGLWAGLKEGHGMGKLAGDSFQLPGVFFLSEGRVILSHPTASAAERISYLDLVQQAIRNWESLNKPANARSQSSASV